MSPRLEDSHLDPSLLPSVEPARLDDPRLVEPVLETIRAAIDNGSILAALVFAGRIYTRKKEECTVAFGDKPNPRYSSANDDFYFQVGVRIAVLPEPSVLERIEAVEKQLNTQRLAEAQAQLVEARTRQAAAEAEVERIQAEIRRAQL